MINEKSINDRVLHAITAIVRSDMSVEPEHARCLMVYTYVYRGEVHFDLGCQNSSPLLQPDPEILQSSQWKPVLELPSLCGCTQQHLKGLAIQAARNVSEMIRSRNEASEREC